MAIGAGVTLFSHSMEWERGFILASAVGTMARLLEQCIQYARQRQQFGQHVAKFHLTELELERELRDAHGSTLYSGTSELQRQILSQFLRL